MELLLERPVVDLVPTLRAIPSFETGLTTPTPLLTPAQRRRVASIATKLEIRPRSVIYRAESPAQAVFINGAGVVKSVQELASGRRRVVAFWFARDLFGLAEDGRFLYTTIAVTPVTLYRLPVEDLRRALLEDAQLQFQFLCKVTHELREAQHQKLLLIRKDAIGRVAMFVHLLEKQDPVVAPAGTIDLPMTRSDVADFLGLTLEAVSRATSELARQRILAIHGRHRIQILDRARFEALAGQV
jgi:CRP-like cAMP-binding protein